MCHLFVGADPTLWENETRSLRLSGMATSVRLERFFWTVLLDIAERDHLTVSQLLQRLYAESLDEGHDLDNFASFLRVCCGRYLALQIEGEIPADRNVTIKSLDAKSVLAREQAKSGLKNNRTNSSPAALGASA
ncbi:ribbon-helix-helix domain-containing protein [Nitratireductor basaltis]|uniref:Arylsulfate sulfotransferase-like protein n=1 Tax=Nitratireductor basaltis TaxID=472175 RepID=A0A084UBG8_9HYPH|nr:ribbon-helix-helix domain-containing protein [Nitratireductor basaltis]KFB10304.1 Arylsulfate sulfotransferase-like protein [Nitratireductor basaltis]